MSIRIITYDLRKEIHSKDYNGILEYIKQHDWAKLSESSYAIDTTSDPEAIYAALESFLDVNDRLLVLTLTAPYYGFHSKEVVDWLEEKLR